jgi:chitin disaccharide deacetylase
MANSRRFVLCADDYAMTPGVSSGVLAALEAGRISAAGAMTNRPSWKSAAPDFAAHSGRADLGLHFNLTCGEPLTPMARLAPGGELPKLGSILKAGVSGRLPLDEIEAELGAQLTAFEDAMGRAPDFIDGHQHVHAMPGVRRVLARILPARYPGTKPYLRVAADSPLRIAARGVEVKKALLVAALTAPFSGQMRGLGFAANTGFSGYSNFDATQDYGAAFARYLIAPGAQHLVMCHPGAVDDALAALDPVTHSRPQERDFLLSSRFEAICAATNMTLSRFSEMT